jgi:hypothetical protein
VSVAHDPPATPSEPAPCLSVDGHGQAVVRIPFDAHLSTGGVLDLDRLSPSTAAAARQLAAFVTGSSRPVRPSSAPAPDPPPPSPSSSGLPGGLSVPALLIDTPARSREQAGVEPPTGPGSAGSPTARPERTVVLCTVVVCTVLAVLAPLAWWATIGSGHAAAVACPAGDRLPAHDGHPSGAAACVATPFGEQAAQDNSPTPPPRILARAAAKQGSHQRLRHAPGRLPGRCRRRQAECGAGRGMSSLHGTFHEGASEVVHRGDAERYAQVRRGAPGRIRTCAPASGDR